jgi:trigger factor
MDIKRVALDAVNETIVITVCMDYKGQVQKKNKRKMPYDR